MDYEKILKEALNSKATPFEVSSWIEEQFPELAKSEDEKIRKALIRFHKSTIDVDGIKGDDIIDWLEKQGEQKPADKVEPIFNVGDKIQYSKGCGTIMTIEKIENGEYIFANNMGHTTIESGNKWHLVEQNPAEWSIFDYRTWQYIVSDVLTKKDGIGQYLDDGGCKKIAKYMQDEWSKRLSVELPKSQDYGIDGLYAAIDILTKTLGEVGGYQSDDGILAHKCSISAVKGLSKQKPAEWSEEDEYTLGETIQHLEELIRIDKAKHCSVDVQYYQRDIDWLKSLKDRVQPKREWNEEDENRFNNLCWLIDQSDENEPTKNGFKNWLKSFKDRIQPQPRQEWSEKDEEILDKVITNYESGYLPSVEKRDEIIKKLKSLRPQNAWKPSDEQIKAVRLARSFVTDDFDENPTLSDVLIELERQLKKLREE